jgi:hypothetical protein
MSFTKDELESFNTILEQRLAAQRREVERAFELRLHAFRRDMEQRLAAMQQDTLRNVSLKLTELQSGLDASLSQKLNMQQTRVAQSMSNVVEQQYKQLEENVERMLAAQLPAIEALLNRLTSLHVLNESAIPGSEFPAHLEAIEVQTELPWEDLVDVIGKALDKRLAVLNQSLQLAMKNLEQYVAVRLHRMGEEFVRGQGQMQPYNRNAPASMQEVFQGIEHLERIIESMQVVMTSNHALLSNRLYHHQQLPLERAHPSSHSSTVHPNGVAHAPVLAKERAADQQMGAEAAKEQ